MDKLKQIECESIDDNIFNLIGKDWMLITAGDTELLNMMTASWGGLGVLWNKNICICFVRPTRHTYKFLEEYEFFSLSFFSYEYRNVLQFCGTKSGRDVDKVKETGLTVVCDVPGAPYFEEARFVIQSRKIYFQDLNPENFLDNSINEHYPERDYHRMYIGEIVKCIKR